MMNKKFTLFDNPIKKLEKTYKLLYTEHVFQGWFYNTDREREFIVYLKKLYQPWAQTLATLNINEKGNALIKDKLEINISSDEAKDLIKHKCTYFCDKKKFYFDFEKDIKLEAHKILTDNEDFIEFIEFKFNSKEEADKFDIKKYFNNANDITDSEAFLDKNLAWYTRIDNILDILKEF